MENLKILRENQNLTQRELSSQVGIPKTNIGHYEIGKTQPNIKNMFKLADFFGCSIDYLIGHETKNLIHVDNLSPVKNELIKKVIAMDESDIGIINGILLRLEDERRNPWMKG